jgi:hypothetical protein
MSSLNDILSDNGAFSIAKAQVQQNELEYFELTNIFLRLISLSFVCFVPYINVLAP